MKMKQITSATNPTYRRLLSLLSSSGIKKHGEFLISGRKLIPEFLNSATATRSTVKLRAILTTADFEPIATSLPKIELPKKLFSELDVLGTHYPMLWGEVPAIETFDFTQPPRGLELVLALSNPLNLGAALRSAEAFCADRVVLLSECAHPFLPKVLRASSGSALRLKLAHAPSIQELAQLLPQSSVTPSLLWALDMKGQNISKYKFPQSFRMLIGEEGLGVPTEFSNDCRLAIPMKTNMDSLNAVAAASIALYAYRAQWPL